MRLFEVLIAGVLLISILLRAFRLEKAAWLNLLPLLNLLLAGYHVFFEGARWQMLPLYGMSAWFIPLALQRTKDPFHKTRPIHTFGNLVLLVIFTALPAALPVPRFPEPPGPYPVGTQSFYWVDESRLEVYSPQVDQVYASNPSEPRRLMVQVWYPAVSDTGEGRAPYLPDGIQDAQALATSFGFPAFFLDHFVLSKSNALLNAQLATCFDQWPVLIFSHGWNGMRYQSTAQMEALASQGYIVFAPEHPYGAVISVYPDGSSTMNKPGALPKDVSDQEYQQAALILGDLWVSDLRFSIDQVEKLQLGEIPSIFAGHMDVARLGLYGHSTGGGAALETCAQDDRCQAAAGLDPWLVPYNRSLPTEALRQPTLLIFSEGWVNKANQPLVESFWQASLPGTIRATLLGAKHYDFSDMPLFSPVAAPLGLKGPISPQVEIPLINDFLFTFFDDHLGNGIATPFDELIEKYPQAVVKTR